MNKITWTWGTWSYFEMLCEHRPWSLFQNGFSVLFWYTHLCTTELEFYCTKQPQVFPYSILLTVVFLTSSWKGSSRSVGKVLTAHQWSQTGGIICRCDTSLIFLLDESARPHPKWNPTTYTAQWVKVGHYKGNIVPFGTPPESIAR